MNTILKNLLVFLLKALLIFVLMWLAFKLTEGTEVTAARLAIYGAVLATLVDYVFDVILKKNPSASVQKISKFLEWNL